jgi:hypothetical protein
MAPIGRARCPARYTGKDVHARAGPRQAGEGAIFDAFLIAYPSFADEVKKVEQPTASFPDVVVELATGGLVDF